MARTLEVPKQVKKATYRYVATTVHGRMVKGTVKAGSEIEAERLIVG